MRYQLLLLLACCLGLVVAQETTVTNDRFAVQTGLEVLTDADGFYAGPHIGYTIDSDYFTAHGLVRFVNDGKWLSTESWMPDGAYFDLRYSYVRLRLLPFSLDGGFLPFTHWYSQNPYLTILDNSGKSGVGLGLHYDGDRISYQSRWVGLNRDSPHVYGYTIGGDNEVLWRDRGFNYKLYMLKLGALRLAYQESSIFLDRYFDANYLLNPAPTIFLNTLWSQGNNPWVHASNDSSMMGLYADYQGGPYRLEAELTFKDFNSPFGYSENLNKFAWSLGGSWDSPYGLFSFWHGGATKHMYAATYSSTDNPNLYPNEYTYYPVSEIDSLTISLEDNYIGFPHGENSLAFSLDWKRSWQLGTWPLDSGLGAEYIIGGSRSPHNPWHEATKWTEIDAKTELFHGDAVLEHKLYLNFHAATRWRAWSLSVDGRLGLIVNPLHLVEVEEDGFPTPAPIWKPQAGVVRNASFVSLRLMYNLEL